MRRGTSDTFSTRTSPESPRPLQKRPLLRRSLALIALILWSGLVLYPNPRPLVVSLERLFRPPLDPDAVAELADRLPNDAVEVEAFSRRSVPYRTAWDLYGQFWYFPTVTETLAAGGGDCQAEAILTASILQAKGLPYTLRYSFDHVWVDYPGRHGVGIEDPATTIASNSGAGWWSGLPQRFPLRDIVRERLQYHWEPMPAVRKALLCLGLLGALVLAEWPLLRRTGRWATRVAGRRPQSTERPE